MAVHDRREVAIPGFGHGLLQPFGRGGEGRLWMNFNFNASLNFDRRFSATTTTPPARSPHTHRDLWGLASVTGRWNTPLTWNGTDGEENIRILWHNHAGHIPPRCGSLTLSHPTTRQVPHTVFTRRRHKVLLNKNSSVRVGKRAYESRRSCSPAWTCDPRRWRNASWNSCPILAICARRRRGTLAIIASLSSAGKSCQETASGCVSPAHETSTC
jgi:hypothetical protein